MRLRFTGIRGYCQIPMRGRLGLYREERLVRIEVECSSQHRVRGEQREERSSSALRVAQGKKDDPTRADDFGAGNALTGMVRYFKISVCLYRERCGLAQ